MIKRLFFLVILVFAFLSFSFCGSEKGHEYITFLNNSDETVYMSDRWQIIIDSGDTLLICNLKQTKLLKDTPKYLKAHNDVWETDFKVLPFLQVFVLSEYSNPTNCTEESISKFQKEHQLKRYRLTREYLDSVDWVITYP